MDVGRADVLRMAALARIALSEEEADRLRRDLEDILGHVGALPDPNDAVHGADGVGRGVNASPEPDAGGTRPDEPGADPLTGGIETFAPEARDGLFTVPRLASHRDPEPG